MYFIGNYKNWIDQSVVDYLLNNDGILRPNIGDNPDVEEFKNAEKAGYDLSKTWWHIYEPHILPFKINLPIQTEKSVIWWFIKLLPSGMMPMHRDPHVSFKNVKNPKRYWMPLQDYEPGHVFVYKNQFITDYNAGDLWNYGDSDELHGACNISYIPRLTFLFTIYDAV